MEKNRLEAFSDGVIAIIITIMVLELKVPHGTDIEAMKTLLPVFLSYLLSFIYVGIYWNNHHHMFNCTKVVTGGILWANLHLLFWLSLFPFATAWIGENHLAPVPVAAYGVVLTMAAVGYSVLQRTIIAQQGANSLLGAAVGKDVKGRMSPVVYLVAIPLSFVSPLLACALYVLVALMWLAPDRRIERALGRSESAQGE